LKVASAKTDEKKVPFLKSYEYKGKKIAVTAEDFKEVMRKVA